MHNPFSLENKTLLVTGASSGIGKGIAIECSKLGARVIITSRSKEKLEQTLKIMDGEGHQIIVADITKKEDIENLVSNLPKLDGLVHNAGINSKRELCSYITTENYNKTISINLEAPMMLQKSILEKKLMKKDSSIVFIASRAPYAPVFGNAVYSASKGALIAYAKVLALELAPRKIRVNSICPAMVWTDLILSESSISKEEYEDSQKKYPLKRYGTPEDIAYLTIYLLSNASSWMTGSCIDITGGGEGTLV